jgi:hypothetical protein
MVCVTTSEELSLMMEADSPALAGAVLGADSSVVAASAVTVLNLGNLVAICSDA